MKDSFEIRTPHAALKIWQHAISEAIVIKTDDWNAIGIDKGDGDEEDYEEGSATILLNLRSAIVLKDILESEINNLEIRLK